MRQIFVNLPVNDLEASRTFFGSLGFSFNPDYSDENAACLVLEENISVMLLVKDFFKGFLTGEVSAPASGTEVILAISAESRQDVDDLTAKALAAGAKPWRPKMEEGGMYSTSFQDLDGHVWEILAMAATA